ncbi:hypothetical protein K443DRAFT_683206 [Laccaria amethystina LaAM-08-1]|uniref:G domain-containing protein n=1 Tax=Laccaria amethystina LaAM-08-1 TaxID=1095629 RepID=A0A0C9WJS6_9AGAR|nr:hypothetical protein K443DRAFT_683206 [Laccaria amethystina LaAM-08-1]
MSDLEAVKLREKYTHFRILVIGRANAGKTTLLKRVCNTDDDPCIYNENGENQLEPSDERGIHDIEKQFVFKSNPQFIFHDSPGFEAGNEQELKDVLSFVEKRSKMNNPNEQLHAIWFCFVLNASRPLLELEQKFFNEQRAGNVPVIAVFTKFDDLVAQLYDRDREEESRTDASKVVKEKFEMPLENSRDRPKAYVCFEALDDSEGDHQEQVKGLIEKTAASLDDLALKMLFVSVQRNNLELCIKYAIYEQNDLGHSSENVVYWAASWFRHCMYNSPTWTAFAAILICLESSFWYFDQNIGFQPAFEQAWKTFAHSDAKKRVEQDISTLIMARATTSLNQKLTEQQKVTFFNIILQNRLEHPDAQDIF